MRPKKASETRSTKKVSTHAPARGATSWLWAIRDNPYVSTHAPAPGATVADRAGVHRIPPFQPTHPHGVRRRRRRQPRGSGPGFNPRTRTGCDTPEPASSSAGQRFNPRTRTGCDAGGKAVSQELPGFNPRTRTGCDGRRGAGGKSSTTFQPTHPHGVRHIILFFYPYGLAVSTHAPARGATCVW